jgi:hypothetical protein
MSTSNPRPGRRLATSPFNREPAEPVIPDVFAVDDRVSHDKYGLGTVVSVNGTREVIVNFGAETRRIALPNPKLSLL